MPHQRINRRAALMSIGAIGAAATLPRFLAGSPAQAADPAWRLSDAQWRKRLQPDRYDILRHAGTETAFSSPLDHETRPGIYACAACNLPLFDAKTKYDSGTGWPSFYAPLPNAVATKSDYSLLEPRTEVHCRRCESHIGHVFDDGPKPTGLRYCMNGLALLFHPATH